MMKSIAFLAALALLATSCQSSNLANSAHSGQQIQSVKSQAVADVAPKSPVLSQVKVKPEVRVQVQGTQVKLEIKLPALSDYRSDFKTQSLDLATAAKITATIKDSYGKTYTPVGAVAGQINYPVSGVVVMGFNTVVPDKLLFVELQVTDGAADIPQADLAVVFNHTGVSNPTVQMNFQTTPTAKAMKALLAANASRARAINLTDLNTLMNTITGVTGVDPNFTYTTHPTLVNTALLATDLVAQDPTALTAATYRQVGATVGLTVSGLVGSDKIEVQSTDAASAIKLAVPNGASNITSATPGTGLKIKVGADAGNSTQYTFVATPSSGIALTNGASTPISIVATPTAVSITSLTPTFGAIGSSVTIAGTGFSTVAANNTVKFGSTTATVTAATATSLTVTVPANIDGTQSVTVQVGTQTSTGQSFDVTPAITSLSIATGSSGDTLDITGTGFHTTAGSNTVKLGSTTLTATLQSPTVLRVTVPGNAAGIANATVQVGTQTSAASGFTVLPKITALTTADVVLGKAALIRGGTLTLNGTNFDTTAANNTVSFTLSNSAVFTATAATVNGAGTQMTVSVPGTVDVSGDVIVRVVTNSQNSNTLTAMVPTVTVNVNSSGFH